MYRPLSIDDLPDVLRNRSDPNFLQFYEETEFGEEEAKLFLHQFLDWEQERPQRRFAFATLERGTGRMVGICSLRREKADASTAEIGFELAPAFWGRGLATEMGRALLDLGFRGLNVHRIQAHCVAENVASQRVLEKLGMRFEGRLREKHRFKERYWDELWFGILRPEWETGTE